MQLLIECTTDKQDEFIHDFCQFTYAKLGIPDPPALTFVERTGSTSFGSYKPSDESIIVATTGRHISDILRTLGHELVHHKQLTGGGNDMSLEELEYEANAIAGMLMRDYNKLHPEMFGLVSPEPTPPDQISDSQGAVFPDVTRPSGPINMAEELLSELSNKTLASYKKKAKHELDFLTKGANWRKYFDRQYFRKQDLSAIREKGINQASAKLRSRYNPTSLEEAKIKETDSDALKLLKLDNMALRAFPSSPKQKEIQKQIDALRKKMKREGTPEYHQTLTELSNKTLASYKTKALQARTAGMREFWYGDYGPEGWAFPNSGKPYPEDKHRTKGIETAKRTLMTRYGHLKEDAVVNSAGSGAITMAEDLLAELSNKTLASYKKRAGHDLTGRTREDRPGWANRFEFREKRTKSGNPRSMQKYLIYTNSPRLVKNRETGIKQAETTLRKRYGALEEDAVVNSAGSGAIAGIGVGPQGEPGVPLRKKKTPMFSRKKDLAFLGMPGVSLKHVLGGKKSFKQMREEISPEDARKQITQKTNSRSEESEKARRELIKRIVRHK